MANNDPMITPNGQLPPMTTVYPEPQISQEPKKPNKFLGILGGIAGSALNLVAPGVGSLIGRAIGGGGSSFGSYGTLMEQQQQFDEMQRYNQISQRDAAKTAERNDESAAAAVNADARNVKPCQYAVAGICNRFKFAENPPRQ